MEKQHIGSLRVSVVGLGCNNFGIRLDEDRTKTVVHAALDAGIDFFDTADAYGATRSEEFLGRALGARRKSVIVATKFGLPLDDRRPGGASRAYVASAVEDSLRRLGTDYIDLYQLHRPDPSIPIAETLGALDDLVKAGKVREVGSSNFTAEQIDEAEGARPQGAARFVSVQNEYSLLFREPEEGVLATCVRRGLGFLPYFPLASGLLTGKYQKGEPPPSGTRLSAKDSPLRARFLNEARVATAERLAEYSRERGISLLDLAIGWLRAQPAVSSIIAGATSPEQVRANVAAGARQLTADDLGPVDKLAPRSPAA